VDAGLAVAAREVGVDRQPRDPGKLLPGKDQGPGVTVFARHVGVHEDVLQLARTATADRSQTQPWAAESEVEGETRPEMRRATVVAAHACLYLQA